MDHEKKVLACYNYLCALEKRGTVVETIDIHVAYITWCQSGMLYDKSAHALVDCAEYLGFHL